ncbi:MAG: HesA/MoeB/ThiF family protein [Lewinellaceae bacterium]|nr:HesA/MoeB/ThiF family protein [Saprospiraceae bacterium]MCB9334336.1 HesA/MoeB/ThiF family protein [Lewinellaceae bacterium]
MQTEFTSDEWQRYLRQMTLPGWSLEGQDRLRQTSVLVIGAGGIGSGLLPYLAGAGIGRLGIVDADMVENTNLHRQTLYTGNDLGHLKVDAAARRLQTLNPHCQVEIFPFRIDASNAVDLLSNFDLIADGTDNTETRYLVNDSCVELDKTLVWGAASGFQGQVSVFNLPQADGSRGPNLRNLFPTPPTDALDCVDAGVLGPLPGIIGAVMAAEVLKIATGIGEPLSGALLVFDARAMQWQRVRFR